MSTMHIVMVDKDMDAKEKKAMMSEIDAVKIKEDGTVVVPENAQYIVAKDDAIDMKKEEIKKYPMPADTQKIRDFICSNGIR